MLPSSLCLWASLGSKDAALAVTSTQSQDDQDDLVRDISSFYCSEEHADICIVVGDARMPAHSIIFAVSGIEASVVRDLLQFL